MTDRMSRQLAVVREAYLSGENAPASVRPEVLASWRRSSAWSVDSQRISSSYLENYERDDRLVEAASAVLVPWMDRFQDLDVAFMVSDAEGRILGRWVAERRLLKRLDSVHAVEGHSYAEDVAGNNAIGTVIELGTRARFDGHEHYIDDFRDFTCVGVPLRDPISLRLRGVLDVTTRFDQANSLLSIVAEQVAAAIEMRLAEGGGRGERLLMQRFLQARRRASGVLVINPRTVISDPKASRLLGRVSQPELWEHAGSTMGSNRTTENEFESVDGKTVHTTLVPMFDGDEPLGVLIHVREGSKGERATALPVVRPRRSEDFVGRSARHLAAVEQAERSVMERPVVLRGPVGTGKQRLARELHEAHGRGDFFVRDAADSEVDGAPTWLLETRGILADKPGTIVVLHIEALTTTVAHALERTLRVAHERGWMVVLTDREETHAFDSLATVVTVPALDARGADIELLIAHFARPATVNREAMQLLRRIQWHGNVAHLQRVVRSLRGETSSHITVADMPADLRAMAVRRNLTRLEKVQVREMLDALAESDGNRQVAADSLGISRSTLYRRLRDAGVDLDKTAF